jgi:chemotaxis protein MotB
MLVALTDDFNAEKAKNTNLAAMLEAESEKGSSAGSAISGLRTDLDKEKSISAEALAKVELLNQQIAAMRRQLSQLNALLTDAETHNRQSEAQIADLGKRLNSALAQRVQELSRYRSEFFGRLRQILAQRSDILVVGDRFVFQSEVLFGKGSSVLSEEGRQEMLKLAEALKQLETEIPADIAWVLRVDGHTDVDPILSLQFKSNWELSAARSIAVVNFLIGSGVTPKHLVAAGFGEFQPIDPGSTEEAKSRNRRIELKLTER